MSVRQWSRTGSKFIGVVLLFGGAIGVAVANPVRAATIPNPVIDITVTPTNPHLTDSVRTDVQWCIPDSAGSGDTFSIALPPELVQLPHGFELRDPGGSLVATASIAGTPAVATFTFTDFVDTHVNVCGTAFFESRLDSSLTVGTTYTLKYVVDGSATFQPQITIQGGGVAGGRDTARKGAFFDDPSDGCRTVLQGCIGWFIESQLGPFPSVTVTDNGLVGATFECSQMSVRLWSVDASGNLLNSFSPASSGVTVTTTCDPNGFEVTATNIPADRLLRVIIHATPTAPSPNGGATFKNVAVVTHVFPTQVVDQDNVVAQRRTAAVGGDASGVLAPTTSTTVPPVDTTPAPTTTVGSAALPPTPAAPFVPPSNAPLPATGSRDVLLWVGVGMILGGLALVIVSSRRRRIGTHMH
ncbi:MAG TPA: Ig-like domain-containing protein [Ilumatobacteraceae bacterium]